MPQVNSSSKSKARIWSKIGERVRRDFFFQAAAGTVPGVSIQYIKGYDPDIGQSLDPIVSSPFEYFDAPEPLSLVSSDINDTYRGSGAGVVRVLGLDQQYKLQMEDVPIRGLTPVITQGDYIRVLEAAVIASGTKQGAAGIISISGVHSSKAVGQLQAPFNTVLNGIYTIPDNTNGYLFKYSFSMGAPKETTVGLRQLSPHSERPTWIMTIVDFMYGGRITEDLDIPLYFPEKTDIELVAYTNVDSTTYVATSATLVLIDKTFEWEQFLYQDETHRLIKDE